MTPFWRFTGYFLEVARRGSLRKAAEVLHVSASGIDRQILQAEGLLETALFERLPRGLKLTAAGELLLDDLRPWRKEYMRTLERLDELKGLKRPFAWRPVGNCHARHNWSSSDWPWR